MTTTTNRIIRALAGIAILSSATGVAAQTGPDENQSRRVGDFEIYYSAIQINQLPEQISKRYKLQRGPNAAMMQVTVRQHAADGSDKAIAATISGTAKSLASKPIVLNFVEHADSDAPLYIAEFKLTPPDTLVYVLHVSAEGLADQEITFQRDYASN
ncbi:MAG: DUF4426 domain-containing protein [Dokdonella sp.]